MFDYDILFTTSQHEFIIGASGGKPVTYDKPKPNKCIIDESELWKSDCYAMGSKIGVITNQSTSLYTMLSFFEKDSLEYKIIWDRLIISRKLQGSEIDKTKLGYAKPLPTWDKRIHITDDMLPEERRMAENHNQLLVNRRPKFMIYLYPDYMRKYKNHKAIFDNYAGSFYECTIKDIISKENKNNFEEELVRKYNRFNPYIISESLMSRVCEFMEENSVFLRQNTKDDKQFSYASLLNTDVEFSEYKLRKMKELFDRYFSSKESSIELEEEYEDYSLGFEDMNRWAYNNISSDSRELANLSVILCYKEIADSSKRDFCWKIFGNEILNNLYLNGYTDAIIPCLDAFGDIHYLNKRYSRLNTGRINLDNLL